MKLKLMNNKVKVKFVRLATAKETNNYPHPRPIVEVIEDIDLSNGILKKGERFIIFDNNLIS